MSLKPRHPPGHAGRKALAHADEILRLRGQGHTLRAIREALEDSGVIVSISTVRREVLRGATTPVASTPIAGQSDSTRCVEPRRAQVGRTTPPPVPAMPGTPLPGRATAAKFMRDRPSLYLEDSP